MSSSTSWPSYSTKLVFWSIPRYLFSLATTCACGATRTLSECGELGMRIFMQGLVGCSMREGVCARAYIQRRALTASRRSMDTSIATRSLSARLRRGRSRTRRRRYRCSRRSCSRRLRDDGAAPAGEDVGPLHSCASLLKQRSISSREPPQAGAPVTLPHYIYIPGFRRALAPGHVLWGWGQFPIFGFQDPALARFM